MASTIGINETGAGQGFVGHRVSLHLARHHPHQVPQRRSCPVDHAGQGRRRGRRRLLGMDAIDTRDSRRLARFPDRALRPGCVGHYIRDERCAQGTRARHSGGSPDSTWQHCIVHLMRNAAAKTLTRQKKRATCRIPKMVFAERNPELVRERRSSAGSTSRRSHRRWRVLRPTHSPPNTAG